MYVRANLKLDEAVNASLLNLRSNPERKLLPIYRRRIYEAFGDIEKPLNQYKRASLELMSAKKVLPVWYKYAKSNQEEESPPRIIHVAEGVLKGTITKQQGLALAQKCMRNLDDDNDDDEVSSGYILDHEIESIDLVSCNPALVPHAAVEALYSVSGVFRFDDVLIEDDTTDTDFDMWSSDTARWAVSAYAGEEWSEYSSPIRRGEFWEWWLLDAVPTAWNIAQE